MFRDTPLSQNQRVDERVRAVIRHEEVRRRAGVAAGRAREMRRRAMLAVQQARELQSEAFSLRLEAIEARRSTDSVELSR